MRVSKPGFLALLVSVSFVALLLPAIATGAPSAEKPVRAASVAPAVVISQEPNNAANNRWAGATDITEKIPHYNGPPAEFRWGTAAGIATGAIFPVDAASSDVDWYKFNVTPDQDEESPLSFMIDVVADDSALGRDPVVEVYYQAVAAAAADAVPACVGLDLDSVTRWPAVETMSWDDDSPWLNDKSPQASLLPHVKPGGVSAPGWYYIRVRPYSNGAYELGVFAYTLRIKPGQVTRLAGADRYATANAVCAEGWDARNSWDSTVTIVNGTKFADALSAAGLAGAAGEGPVLLCPGTSISHATIAQIQRMGTDKVYLMGSTVSISDAVRTHILAHIPGAHIKRIDGADRFAVSANAAREIVRLGGLQGDLAFLADGLNWPDALVSTPMAFYNKAPILLTRKDSIPPSTRAFLQDPVLTEIVILGGTGSVSNAVKNLVVSDMGAPGHVKRISGANRYAVAKNFAWWACDLEGDGTLRNGHVGTALVPQALHSLAYRHVGVVSGENFPDALSAGAFCGKSTSPLLMTNRLTLSPYIFAPDDPSIPAEGMYFNGDSIRRSYLIGGSPTVSNSVFRDLDYNTGFAGASHQ